MDPLLTNVFVSNRNLKTCFYC